MTSVQDAVRGGVCLESVCIRNTAEGEAGVRSVPGRQVGSDTQGRGPRNRSRALAEKRGYSPHSPEGPGTEYSPPPPGHAHLPGPHEGWRRQWHCPDCKDVRGLPDFPCFSYYETVSLLGGEGLSAWPQEGGDTGTLHLKQVGMGRAQVAGRLLPAWLSPWVK